MRDNLRELDYLLDKLNSVEKIRDLISRCEASADWSDVEMTFKEGDSKHTIRMGDLKTIDLFAFKYGLIDTEYEIRKRIAEIGLKDYKMVEDEEAA